MHLPMPRSILSPRPIALCAALFAVAAPAAAQQQPSPQAAPQQTQAVPPSSQMPQGAWPGPMPGPMQRGMMMQQGQPSGPQTMPPQGGPGMMMRGPMQRGMPMQPYMQQQGGQGGNQAQPGMPQGPQDGRDMMPGQMPQGPMMGAPGPNGPMYGPMYGRGMHHGHMGPMMGGPMGGPMMGGPMMGGPMMGGMCPMGGPDFAEGRLAFIKAELGITDKQQAAFDAFAKVVKSHAEGRDERHQAIMQAMTEAQTPLDRLGARIAMMEVRVGMMKEMKSALDKLYGTLTDEQKQKADFLLPGMGGMRCMM